MAAEGGDRQMRERISRLARGEELKEELRLTVEPGEVCLDLAARRADTEGSRRQ